MADPLEELKHVQIIFIVSVRLVPLTHQPSVFTSQLPFVLPRRINGVAQGRKIFWSASSWLRILDWLNEKLSDRFRLKKYILVCNFFFKYE